LKKKIGGGSHPVLVVVDLAPRKRCYQSSKCGCTKSSFR
jgi:hypothetical protein